MLQEYFLVKLDLNKKLYFLSVKTEAGRFSFAWRAIAVLAVAILAVASFFAMLH